MKESYCLIETSLGLAGSGFNGNDLVRFWLPGLIRERLLIQILKWSSRASERTRTTFETKVTKYFEGKDVKFDEKISIIGVSRFHSSVYENLRNVGRGKTVTYSELATLSGNPKAARSVGSAMARNPIPLIIPCHRVIRKDGSIGDFSGPGGGEQKRKMLRMENISI